MADHCSSDAVMAQIDDDSQPQTPTPTLITIPISSSPHQVTRCENDLQGGSQVEAQVNEAKLIESFPAILVQGAVTLLTLVSSSATNHPLSGSAKILQNFAAGNNIFGYISFFTSTLMCGQRILNVIGYAGASFGFLALVAVVLTDDLNLWVAAVACVAYLPALFAAAGFRA